MSPMVAHGYHDMARAGALMQIGAWKIRVCRGRCQIEGCRVAIQEWSKGAV